MDQLRRILGTINGAFASMSVTLRLLLGSLAVIAVMMLFLVAQYTARPDMIGLVRDDPNLDLVDTLRMGGIEATVVDGQIVVPRADRLRAVAQLGEAGQLPGNTEIMFNNLMEFQDWKASREENRQRYIFALQNELARAISMWSGVESAKVVIDAPPPGGLGRTSRPPTASASIFGAAGGGLAQQTVDAAARMIAGAVAGLDATDVEIIDGSGRPRRVTSAEDALATSYLEHAQLVERMTQEKIRSLLGHIDGVVVSVSAQVDVTRVTTERLAHLPEEEGSVRIQSQIQGESTSTENRSTSGEPGVRSNQQADIATGGGSGTSSETSDEMLSYQVAIGSEATRVVDPRGMPTYLVASVNVPEGYIEGLVVEGLRRAAPEGDEPPAPTRAEITQQFEAMRPTIEAFIAPHLRTADATGALREGEVTVSMVPMLGGGAGGIGGGLFGPGAAMANASALRADGGNPGLISAISIGVLAVVALAMMLLLVKRTGQGMELPSAEELVGIPETLEGGDGVVGEAMESDAVLDASEVNEDDMQHDRMMEQVTDLVASDPDTATRLLERWIRLED